MAHIHSVYDTDPHFSIDAKTRAVANLSADKWTLMQYDHNSERITFELPRHIDGHDMTLCNQVQVHYINIGENGERNTGIYEVEDLAVSPNGTDVAICSWLISRNATSLVGALSFIVRFSCVTDGSVDYSWNTAIYNDISISNGINNSDAIVEEYADVLMQWSLELERMGMIVDELDSSTATQEDIANAIKQNRVFYGTSDSTSDQIDIYLDANSMARWDKLKDGDILFAYLTYGFPVADPEVDVYLSTGWTGYLRTATTYNRNTSKRSSIRAKQCRLGSMVAFIYNDRFGGWISPFLQMATTTYYGLVKLNNTVTSTSTEEAATANAVKEAYDKAVEAANSGRLVHFVGGYYMPGMTWQQFVDSAFNKVLIDSEGKPWHEFAVLEDGVVGTAFSPTGDNSYAFYSRLIETEEGYEVRSEYIIDPNLSYHTED